MRQTPEHLPILHNIFDLLTHTSYVEDSRNRRMHLEKDGAGKLPRSSSGEGDPIILRQELFEGCRESGISLDVIRVIGILDKSVGCVRIGRDTNSRFKGNQESSERVMNSVLQGDGVEGFVDMLR